MEKLLKFSPGQAGGIKSAATADHLFLLRGLMATAIEQKTNLFVTFFDVTKAYDRADVKNMLHTIWNAGIKGKMWRLLKGLSTNLTAVVKTKFGPSREIERYNGGKQGSRIIGRLFAKQMDTLSEDFIENRTECVKISEDFSIGCLEWVDDVLSTTTGMKNQLSVLKIIDEFAIKNKLEWGESKCQVMQVGKKIQVPEQWQLGPKMIANTNSYKYLGDTVTNDNKNKRNLEIRENGVQAMIRQINTTASSDIMRGIESKVLLTLYETCIIPSLLNNCESWMLVTLGPTLLLLQVFVFLPYLFRNVLHAPFGDVCNIICSVQLIQLTDFRCRRLRRNHFCQQRDVTFQVILGYGFTICNLPYQRQNRVAGLTIHRVEL